MAKTEIPEKIPTVLIRCRFWALPDPLSGGAVNEPWRERGIFDWTEKMAEKCYHSAQLQLSKLV